MNYCLNNEDNNLIIDSIVFNALDARYVVFYHELGFLKKDYYYISKNDLHDNELKKKEKAAKWGKNNKKLNKIDINLYTILSDFDKKHNSMCQKEYLNGGLDHNINYSMTNIFKNRYYSFKEKVKLLWMANKQKKYRSVNVDNPKGLYIGPSIASFALIIGLLGIGGLNIKNKKTNSSTVINDVNMLIDNGKMEKTLDTEIELVVDQVSDVNKDNSIHDSFVLDEVDLEYSPIENIKHINTNSLDYVDNYKISLVSVYDGDKILCNRKVDSFDDETINELIESLNNEYGTETKKYVNWNGFDKEGKQVLEYVGWSNIENLEVKDVSYNEEQIQKLNKAKKKLLSYENRSNFKSYQKVLSKKRS